MTDQTTPQTISAALKDAIREAGGIVHGDGNIFFTNAEQFTKAALAASAPVAPAPRDLLQAVENALDTANAPIRLDDGHWLSLPERIAALAAPQQGEYLPLPAPNHRGPCGTGSYFDAYTAEQMRAYVDADRAARGAAQAAPAPVAEAAIALLSEVAHYFTGDDDLPNDLLPRIDALLRTQQEGGEPACE